MARQRLPDLSIVLYCLREALGWSQTDLARAAGLSPNLINDYEAGRKTLTRERLEHLLSFMDLQPGRIDAEREPRLAWVVRHNLLGFLIQLGRAEEARQRLPEVRRLAEQLGGELDLQRVGWLEAKISYGLGDFAEARNRFEEVRRAFDKPELSYDYALVSTELSQVLLELGETVRVRAIAEEMFWIFHRQAVHVEALKALRIFCEAARKETATVELARRVIRYLYRAQGDPELRFEEAGAR